MAQAYIGGGGTGNCGEQGRGSRGRVLRHRLQASLAGRPGRQLAALSRRPAGARGLALSFALLRRRPCALPPWWLGGLHGAGGALQRCVSWLADGRLCCPSPTQPQMLLTRPLQIRASLENRLLAGCDCPRYSLPSHEPLCEGR